MHTDTSGGDIETDVNELAAKPRGTPPTVAQTAATPDGKQPKARRNWVTSVTGCRSFMASPAG
jgi:hypothetical protein